MSASPAGQLGVCERKELSEEERTRKCTLLVSYTHFGCLHNKSIDGAEGLFYNNDPAVCMCPLAGHRH